MLGQLRMGLNNLVSGFLIRLESMSVNLTRSGVGMTFSAVATKCKILGLGLGLVAEL